MAFDYPENNIGAGRKKKRGVGREALILACMLEAEAMTFIPQNVAKNWNYARQEGAEGDQDETLLDLCRVLQDLPHFLKCVDPHLRKRQDDNRVEIKVSERKLKKAIDLWLQIDNEDAWVPAKHGNAQTERILRETFAAVFPESIARRSGDGWYAAGLRVREMLSKN
jgi:hypothetical protein